LEVEFLGEDGKVYKKVLNVGDNDDSKYVLKVIEFELSLAPPKEEKDEETKPEKAAKDETLEDSPLIGIWEAHSSFKLKLYNDRKAQGNSGSYGLLQGKWSVLNKKKGRYTIVWAHVLPHTEGRSKKGHPIGTYRQMYALVLLNGESELLYKESWVPFTASSEEVTGTFLHYKRTSADPDVEPKVK
jgi:hypothetical protein